MKQYKTFYSLLHLKTQKFSGFRLPLIAIAFLVFNCWLNNSEVSNTRPCNTVIWREPYEAVWCLAWSAGRESNPYRHVAGERSITEPSKLLVGSIWITNKLWQHVKYFFVYCFDHPIIFWIQNTNPNFVERLKLDVWEVTMLQTNWNATRGFGVSGAWSN